MLSLVDCVLLSSIGLESRLDFVLRNRRDLRNISWSLGQILGNEEDAFVRAAGSAQENKRRSCISVTFEYLYSISAY